MATQFSQFPAFLVKAKKTEQPLTKKRKTLPFQDEPKTKEFVRAQESTIIIPHHNDDDDCILVRCDTPESILHTPNNNDNETVNLYESSKDYSDAITQTSNEFQASKETQTDITCLKDGASFEKWCRAERQNVTAGGYKAMYSLTKPNEDNPPLKLGLTLPKNRVRRVFYPGLENNGIDED